MFSALLQNGKIITAIEYNKEVHGDLKCIDCKVPVIFVPTSESSHAHFKTTGKNESKHSSLCGFAKPLSFEESIQKVGEYQSTLLESGIKENVIRLSLHTLDPDYIKKEIEREQKDDDKHKNPSEIKVKQDSEVPNTIGSLKAVVKLLTQNEPDILSSILINVKGKKIPLSQILVSPKKAHELLWSGQPLENINYFVYGTIEKVQRRDKVYYINFTQEDGVSFSLVVFQKYFKHFTYSDELLIGKKVLTWGGLKKNDFQDKQTTEMVIKSDKYITFLPRDKSE